MCSCGCNVCLSYQVRCGLDVSNDKYMQADMLRMQYDQLADVTSHEEMDHCSQIVVYEIHVLKEVQSCKMLTNLLSPLKLSGQKKRDVLLKSAGTQVKLV